MIVYDLQRRIRGLRNLGLRPVYSRVCRMYGLFVGRGGQFPTRTRSHDFVPNRNYNSIELPFRF